MPLVSVIVPLFNQAEFVSETIESVMSQTCIDYELIIVNDASTDNSLAVASRYANRWPYKDRIKIISNPVNRGLPATRNVAVSHSSGQFILPLDSDDRIDPEFIERTVPRMTPEVGLVSTWIHIEPTEPMRAAGHCVAQMGAPGSGYPIHIPTREEILNGNCLSVCSLMRRETLNDVGGYPEEFTRGSEDWAVWALIAHSKWKIDVVQEYLFHYRVHPNSMCRSAIMDKFENSRDRIRAKCGWKP